MGRIAQFPCLPWICVRPVGEPLWPPLVHDPIYAGAITHEVDITLLDGVDTTFGE